MGKQIKMVRLRKKKKIQNHVQRGCDELFVASCGGRGLGPWVRMSRKSIHGVNAETGIEQSVGELGKADMKADM